MRGLVVPIDIERHAALGERAQHARIAQAARVGVFALAADDGDPFMPHVRQISDGRRRSGGIVGRDARKVSEGELRGGVCDEHGGDMYPGKGLDKVLAAAAEEEDTLRLYLAHALQGTAHLVVELADIVHHKLVIPARRHGLEPFDQRGEQLVVRAADDDEDVVAVGLLEIAGVRVELKALLLHDRHDLLSRLFAHMRLVVEHARDRAERISGKSRQVLDRHQPFTAPAATPLMMCFWQQR